MERENKAHSWSLEIKIEAFWDKNGSFRRNNEHAVKKIEKKHMEREDEAEIKIEAFWDKNGSFRRNNKHVVKKIDKKTHEKGKWSMRKGGESEIERTEVGKKRENEREWEWKRWREKL